MECSNYLCRNVTYSNQYFPTSMEIYGPNGIEVINDISAEESYRLAFTSYYTGCIYREVTENSTVFFILAGDGTVDRLELKKTLVSETTPNYFGEAIPMHNSGKVITSPGQYYNFHIYNNEIFYPGGDWTYGKFSWNTGVMVVGGHLYAVSGLVMKDYNLETGEVREYDIPADAISKTRVDGDGRIYIEASKSESICKLDLGDGGFQVSRTPSQLMTLKKVLANEGQES